MSRCEPRTPGTTQAILKAIITNPLQTWAEDMETHLPNVEEFTTNFQVLAGKPLDEYLGVTKVIDLCATYLTDRLELATKDVQYASHGIHRERRRDKAVRPIIPTPLPTGSEEPKPIGRIFGDLVPTRTYGETAPGAADLDLALARAASLARAAGLDGKGGSQDSIGEEA